MPDPWTELAPFLDTTLDQLNESDRQVLLLRFYRRLPWKQIGGLLEVGEDAARMRVQRALERLRQKLVAVVPGTTGTATLAALLEARAGGTAPLDLQRRIVTTATTRPWRRASSAGKATPVLPRLGFLALVSLGVLVVVSRVHSTRTDGRSGGSSALDSGRSGVTGTTPARTPARLPRSASPGNAGEPLSADVAAQLAHLRAILSSTVPDQSNPPNDLRDCIRELASQPEPTFEILVATLRDPASPRVTLERALWGFWLLNLAVPEMCDRIEPELIGVLRTAGAEPIWVPAAEVLRQMGTRAGTVAELAAALPANPAAIGSTLRFWETAAQRQPEATAAALRPWLDKDTPYRFAAAVGLAQLPDERAPDLAAILAAGFQTPFGSSPSSVQQVALNGLQKLGPRAAGEQVWLAGLLTASDRQTHAWIRPQVIETLAEIAPSTRTSLPEVDQFLHGRDEVTRLQALVSTETPTIDELTSCLQNPATSWKAALRLQGLGPDATAALPALRKALENLDRTHQSYFSDAIKAIDPESPRPIYSRDDIIAAVRAVAVLAEQPDLNLTPTGAEWVQDFLQGSAACRPAELSDYAGQLRAIHPRLQAAWVEALVKLDPALRPSLTTAAGMGATPAPRHPPAP